MFISLPAVRSVFFSCSQDRVLINRLDNLCTLVLSGQWPSGRRYLPEAQLNLSSEVTGDELAFSRMIRKPPCPPSVLGPDGEDGEFTVKLLKVRLRSSKTKITHSDLFFCLNLSSAVVYVLTRFLSFQEEGLKLTFSKQALMPNGSGGESSSRKKRKDQEVRCIAMYSLKGSTTRQLDADSTLSPSLKKAKMGGRDYLRCAERGKCGLYL